MLNYVVLSMRAHCALCVLLVCIELVMVCSFFHSDAYKCRAIAMSKTKMPMAKLGLNKEPLELCDENASIIIDEIRQELGTIFGYDLASRQVGITGRIELVEVDGPTLVVSLSGRFWHATDTVMLRVESYIKQRIPEVIEVKLDITRSDIQDDNRLGGNKLF